MITDRGQAGRPAPPRPNPFMLGTDTVFRFWLLTAAVVATVPYLAAPYGYRFAPGADAARRRSLACVDRMVRGAGSARSDNLVDRLGDAAQAIETACSPTSQLSLSLYTLGVILAVFAVAVAVYWLSPVWRVRRRRLLIVSTDTLPDLHEYLTLLCREAGVGQVRFVVDLLDRRTTGLAFGRRGRRQVMVTAGLLATRSADPQRLRATVLHELAHIRNGDIDPTYLSLAIWRSYLWLVLIPAMIAVPGAGPHRWLPLALRILSVALLVLLIRNGVLRSRELYADLRANGWGGGDALRRILTDRGGARRRWTLLRRHPDTGRRLTTLTDPGGLLYLRFGDGLALGITTVLGQGTVRLWLGWLPGRDAGPEWLPLIIFTGPLAYVLTAAAFRAAVAGRLTGKRPATVRVGAGLGAGFVLATVVTPQATSIPLDNPANGVDGLAPATWMIWSASVVVLGWLFAAWLLMTADAWSPLVTSRRSTTWPVLLCSGGATMVITSCLTFALGLPSLVNITSRLVFPEVPQVVVLLAVVCTWALLMSPATMTVLFVVVWALPLAGSVAGRRARRPRPWVCLDPLPGGDGWQAPQVRGDVVLYALATGAAAAFYPAVLVDLWTALTVSGRPPAAFGILLIGFPFGLGALAAVCAAVVALVTAPALPSVHALLAAGVTAVPATVLAWSVLSATLCLVRLNCALSPLPPHALLLLGARAALTSSGVLVVLVGAARALRQRAHPPSA